MNWRKFGLIFSPSGRYPWMASHATNPVALGFGNGMFRIYFASRDEQNRSHVGYVEFDIRNPKDILCVPDKPVLAPGPLGYFDDHGVYASSIVKYGSQLFLYYMGWNPGVKHPLFYTSIGLAVSEDEGRTFRKFSPAPILARSEFDPWMVSGPFVMIDNSIWRMWYISGIKWEREENQLNSYYHIKYAESKDGINWKRNGLVCIDLLPGEKNISRPCVIKEDIYKMWYSYNCGKGYRIGYAESLDGYSWKRMDDMVGIDVSPRGWDSKAIAYPWVFAYGSQKFMLYNGNNFGKDGFGLALAE